MAVTALDVALAGVAGTLLAPVVGGWIERGNAHRRQRLDRQLARDNLNFAEKKSVYGDVMTHAQRLGTSARRLHHWTEVGGEEPELLELLEDDEQAALAGRLAAFASDAVTDKTQLFWALFFEYLAVSGALHEGLEGSAPAGRLAELNEAEAHALAAFRDAGVELRSAVRADLAEP
jgi:hypothetical protein